MERGHVILFTRYTMRSADISVIPEFTDKIERLGVRQKFRLTKDEITNIKSGTRIPFRGVKVGEKLQTANLKSIEGVTTWICDEATEIPNEDIFDDIQRSVRVKGIQNRIILVLNPSYKSHWIYKRFFVQPHPNTTYIHTTYLDNLTNLNSDWVADAQRLKVENEAKYNHAYLGEWADLPEGLCHRNWQAADTMPQRNDFLRVYGIDFGFSTSPATLVEVIIDTRSRQAWVRVLIYEYGITDYELAQRAKAMNIGAKPVVYDSANASGGEELKRAGLNAKPAKKGAGSVEQGVNLFNSFFISVVGSPNFINELQSRRWSPVMSSGREPMPMPGNDHAIDAVTYTLRNYGSATAHI